MVSVHHRASERASQPDLQTTQQPLQVVAPIGFEKEQESTMIVLLKSVRLLIALQGTCVFKSSDAGRTKVAGKTHLSFVPNILPT